MHDIDSVPEALSLDCKHAGVLGIQSTRVLPRHHQSHVVEGRRLEQMAGVI
jgi:hypothetical protein